MATGNLICLLDESVLLIIYYMAHTPALLPESSCSPSLVLYSLSLGNSYKKSTGSCWNKAGTFPGQFLLNSPQDQSLWATLLAYFCDKGNHGAVRERGLRSFIWESEVPVLCSGTEQGPLTSSQGCPALETENKARKEAQPTPETLLHNQFA